MAQQYQVTVSFEMSNGKLLELVYMYKHWPATYWEPDDVEVNDGIIYIDGDEVDADKLPKGLDAIVDQMYETDGKDVRFGYKNEAYEPEPGYYDDF